MYDIRNKVAADMYKKLKVYMFGTVTLAFRLGPMNPEYGGRRCKVLRLG